VVYAKRPFAGPKAMLAYLSRYTHRVAISNSRMLLEESTDLPAPVEKTLQELMLAPIKLYII
jgi:hypothetical protein